LKPKGQGDKETGRPLKTRRHALLKINQKN